GADGLPGRTSMKKLPSRKIRGRIARVASLWIGRPMSSIVIVTIEAVHCDCDLPSTLQPETGPTLETLPTFTPPILTSESGRSPLALEKIARTVYGLANGLANFVKPR